MNRWCIQVRAAAVVGEGEELVAAVATLRETETGGTENTVGRVTTPPPTYHPELRHLPREGVVLLNQNQPRGGQHRHIHFKPRGKKPQKTDMPVLTHIA